VLERPVNAASPASRSQNVNNELVDTSQLSNSLVDEVVTSGGDSELWGCQPDEEECEPGGGAIEADPNRSL